VNEEMRDAGARTRLVVALAIVAFAALAAGCDGGDPTNSAVAAGGQADLVLKSATVRTVDPGNPVAAAVAVTDGRISVVGSEQQALASAGPQTKVIDLDGGAVVPGFIDSHLHAVEAGLFAELCFLPSSRGVGFYVRRLRQCARQQRGQGWVRGSGPFVQDLIALRPEPRELLDRAIPNRPTVINDALGHAAFVNSEGLRAAGIDDGDPDPRGGGFIRTGGRLNGVLLENAQNVALDAAEQPSRRTRRQNDRALRVALGEIAANGITTVSDAGGYWPRGHHLAWERAERRGELTVRASNALWVYPNRPFAKQVRAIARLRSDNPGSLLRFNTVKIYVDGIVDYGTAALDRPYRRQPRWTIGGRRGFTYFSRRMLNRYVAEFDRRGFQVHLHVWGDRATRLALDAIERAQRLNGNEGGPHRLTHIYLANESDRDRFAELGVTADMQLGVEATSPAYARSLRGVIGRADSERLLPVKSLLDAGANTVLSSDWDADALSPLGTMERALTRASSAEKVADTATALRMVTLDPARLLDQDEITGSIDVGKRADLAVLDRDPLALTSASIGEIEVLLTLLEGREVYRAAGFGG
jgi:predicted amidohydrolase YtcJ